MSCGPKKDFEFYATDKKDFDHMINKQSAPAKPDMGKLKTILNRDYPIEIALFEDGKWYYDLPNLDDGFGTWKYEDGAIKLYAERDLFDMEIDVVALKESAKELGIMFVDRYGLQTMKAEKINSNK